MTGQRMEAAALAADAQNHRSERPEPALALGLLLDGAGVLLSKRTEDADGISATVRIGGRDWHLAIEVAST